MKVLYCGMQYDYGDPARGWSFEHTNFYNTLVGMGHQVVYFDFMALKASIGRGRMNARLWEVVRAERPVLLFAVLFTNQFQPETIRRISRESDTVTFNWFCDDHWRFDSYSRFWAPQFNWVATTDSQAIAKYHAIGHRNVIKTQWACNHFAYRPVAGSSRWDLSFVGQPHSNRREVISRLRSEGLDVYCRGLGWPEGRATHEEMLEIFSRSKINVNLSNAWNPWWRFWERRRDQIKGRNFEVPGTGGFLLTQATDSLDEYYEIGREIVCFRNTAELIKLTRHYLSHEEERAAIARAGYERTLRDHTYEKRFQEIFAAMGLPTAAPRPEGAGPGEREAVGPKATDANPAHDA